MFSEQCIRSGNLDRKASWTLLFLPLFSRILCPDLPWSPFKRILKHCCHLSRQYRCCYPLICIRASYLVHLLVYLRLILRSKIFYVSILYRRRWCFVYEPLMNRLHSQSQAHPETWNVPPTLRLGISSCRHVHSQFCLSALKRILLIVSKDWVTGDLKALILLYVWRLLRPCV